MSMLQPLKDLSTNIVTLSFQVFNFEHLDGTYTSDMKEHNGIYWCVRLQSNKTVKSAKRRMSIYLVCNPNNPSDEWSVTVSFGFRVLNRWGQSKNKISCLFYHTFNANETFKGTQNFVSWDEIVTPNSGFLKDGMFTVEFDLNVTSFTGIKKHKMTREVFEKYIKTGTLLVEGQELGVCLALLAENSRVFYNMFYLDNPEKKTTFEIYDFAYESVLGMVSILQLDAFDIRFGNFLDLLELGQTFEIQAVLDKCEEFLLKCKRVSPETKLKISERFALHNLQFRTLEAIKCTKDVDDILDNNFDLGEKTYMALLEKLTYLQIKEKGRAKCTCGKHDK